MELVRAYKKEARLAYAARQLPCVGTLHIKKGRPEGMWKSVLKTLKLAAVRKEVQGISLQ